MHTLDKIQKKLKEDRRHLIVNWIFLMILWSLLGKLLISCSHLLIWFLPLPMNSKICELIINCVTQMLRVIAHFYCLTFFLNCIWVTCFSSGRSQKCATLLKLGTELKTIFTSWTHIFGHFFGEKLYTVISPKQLEL